MAFEVERDVADIAKSLGTLAEALADNFGLAESLSNIAQSLSEVADTLESIDKHLVEVVDREDQT